MKCFGVEKSNFEYYDNLTVSVLDRQKSHDGLGTRHRNG